jgi:alcohol dehydrogenase class IV
LIESYISRRAKPVPRALALEGLPLALNAIETAVADGQNRPAREAMAHAALLSGMALANSGLGLAHGVAAALGVHHGVSHGRACALMLPVALAENRAVSEQSLAELAVVCGLRGNGTAAGAVDALLARIDTIAQRVGMPRRLHEVGVRREQLVELARDSRGNSLDGNPRAIEQAELVEILGRWL